MSKQSALVKRTAVYAVGNFGSKILAYVMVLVYSYYIAAEDMGYYDIILTTISMVQPLILFQINDGVYRYLVDAKKQKQGAIIGTGFRFLCLTTLVAEILLIGLNFFIELHYPVWIGALLASTMFFVYLQDVVRGLGKSKLYAAMGILNSVVMLGCEVVGLLVLKLGVQALVISKVIANLTCILVMLICEKEVYSSFQVRLHWQQLSPLLKYSAPLVPNTISWWIVNSSSRYIILGFLGASFNGIFSMASKFPTILTTITSIFYLAWQESAIKEYDSPNRDSFFSDVFKKYYTLLLTLCICAIPATRVVIELFVSQEYKIAWQYTGFLYLGAAFSALCSFLGMGYQISKETARSFATTVFAAMLNIGVNVLLVWVISLQSASIATFSSYLFLFLIRIKHTKRYFTLSVDWKRFWSLTVSALVMIGITMILPNLWMCIPVCMAGVWALFVMNKELALPLVNKLKGSKRDDNRKEYE